MNNLKQMIKVASFNMHAPTEADIERAANIAKKLEEFGEAMENRFLHGFTKVPSTLLSQPVAGLTSLISPKLFDKLNLPENKRLASDLKGADRFKQLLFGHRMEHLVGNVQNATDQVKREGHIKELVNEGSKSFGAAATGLAGISTAGLGVAMLPNLLLGGGAVAAKKIAPKLVLNGLVSDDHIREVGEKKASSRSEAKVRRLAMNMGAKDNGLLSNAMQRSILNRDETDKVTTDDISHAAIGLGNAGIVGALSAKPMAERLLGAQTFYHGTNPQAVEKILQTGLNPSYGGHPDGATYKILDREKKFVDLIGGDKNYKDLKESINKDFTRHDHFYKYDNLSRDHIRADRNVVRAVEGFRSSTADIDRSYKNIKNNPMLGSQKQFDIGNFDSRPSRFTGSDVPKERLLFNSDDSYDKYNRYKDLHLSDLSEEIKKKKYTGNILNSAKEHAPEFFTEYGAGDRLSELFQTKYHLNAPHKNIMNTTHMLPLDTKNFLSNAVGRSYVTTSRLDAGKYSLLNSLDKERILGMFDGVRGAIKDVINTDYKSKLLNSNGNIEGLYENVINEKLAPGSEFRNQLSKNLAPEHKFIENRLVEGGKAVLNIPKDLGVLKDLPVLSKPTILNSVKALGKASWAASKLALGTTKDIYTNIINPPVGKSRIVGGVLPHGDFHKKFYFDPDDIHALGYRTDRPDVESLKNVKVGDPESVHRAVADIKKVDPESIANIDPKNLHVNAPTLMQIIKNRSKGKDWLRYVKNNPGRFSQGLGLGALNLGMMGLTAYNDLQPIYKKLKGTYNVEGKKYEPIAPNNKVLKGVHNG